jgi:hypothetical protein
MTKSVSVGWKSKAFAMEWVNDRISKGQRSPSAYSIDSLSSPDQL